MSTRGAFKVTVTKEDSVFASTTSHVGPVTLRPCRALAAAAATWRRADTRGLPFVTVTLNAPRVLIRGKSTRAAPSRRSRRATPRRQPLQAAVGRSPAQPRHCLRAAGDLTRVRQKVVQHLPGRGRLCRRSGGFFGRRASAVWIPRDRSSARLSSSVAARTVEATPCSASSSRQTQAQVVPGALRQDLAAHERAAGLIPPERYLSRKADPRPARSLAAARRRNASSSRRRVLTAVVPRLLHGSEPGRPLGRRDGRASFASNSRAWLATRSPSSRSTRPVHPLRAAARSARSSALCSG